MSVQEGLAGTVLPVSISREAIVVIVNRDILENTVKQVIVALVVVFFFVNYLDRRPCDISLQNFGVS